MTHSLIQHCRGCFTPTDPSEVVLEMAPMPLAGTFCETHREALSAPLFPLTWIRCHGCGLIQVLEDIPDSILYSRYNYASSTIPSLVNHFREYAVFLTSRYGPTGVSFLEIGCNDGVLLNQLPADWQVTGVDPSDVAHRAAVGYRLLSAPFSHLLVETERLEATQDVVSGSNCLAHISDLRDVFEGVHRALKPGGHFWLEVHDLAALLDGNQWDTIYHEHKVEWSLESLINCLAPVGFSFVEVTRLPLHGGILRACFEKSAHREKGGADVRPYSTGLQNLRRAYERRYVSPAVGELRRFQAEGKRIAAYGASGRGNVYLNQISDLAFEFVVDESPLRAGKFLPRIGTPIVGPDRFRLNQPDACLITAWNYRDVIIAKHPTFQGNWLTAFEAGQ